MPKKKDNKTADKVEKSTKKRVDIRQKDSKKETEKLLKDVKLTENAIKRIEELKEDNKDVFIRIMITSGGCAGSQYYILMDDYIGETDYVLKLKKYNIKNDKIKKNEELVFLVIDEVSLEILHNSTIDFEDGLEFSGFKIDNPNVTATCNCGNSFTCGGGFVVKKSDCKN